MEETRACKLNEAGKPNQALSPSELDSDLNARRLMSRALQRLGLPTRACHWVVKVARTIADLAAFDGIEAAHLSEAIDYRRLNRSGLARA